MQVLLAVFLAFVLMWLIPGRSRSFARGITTFALCAVLIPILAFISSAAWTLRVTLLNPGFHKDVLLKVGMYPALPDALAQAVSDTLNGGGPSQGNKTTDPLKTFVSQTLTPAWLEWELGQTVESVFGYLDGKTSSLELDLDMREVKERATAFLASAGNSSPILSGLPDVMARIPDRVSSSTLPQLAQLEAQLSGLRPGVQLALLAGPVTAALVAALAFVAWLIAGRGRRARAWLGSALLEAGGAVVIMGFVARPMILQFAAGLKLPPQFARVPVQAWFEMSGLRLLGVWQTIGSAVLAAGMALIIVRRLPWRMTAPGSTESTD